MIVAAATTLMLLHAPGGREIRVNPKTVASMHATMPGQPNAYVAEEAQCLINLTDGKFVSVVETCERVQELMNR